MKSTSYRIVGSLLSLLTLTGAVTAQDAVTSKGSVGAESKVAKVSPAEMYRPTAIPDRIVQSINGDPRTTRAVSWRTSTAVTTGIAEITVASATPYFAEKAKQSIATTQALLTDLNEAHFHTVIFSDLTPGTKYVYRVGDGTNWSEWFHFSTATQNPQPFSFIYFGDAQNNLRSMWSRVIREAYSDAPKAAFLLHAGDLINSAQADAEWGEWCGSGAWLNAMMPNVAVPGNHEQAKAENGTRHLSHHWRPQFELPLNGPIGLEETCFTFVYHNMRFIGLNSNVQQEIQAKWLDQLLAENQSQWVVCSFHHPIYSTAKDRDNPALRDLWKPILDKHKVDLVLTGHDHSYGRTGLQVPDTIELPKKETDKEKEKLPAEKSASTTTTSDNKVADGAIVPAAVKNVSTGVQHIDSETGTVYVVSVSGPKMYNNHRHPFMKRLAEDLQLYQIIHIDGDKLRFEAHTAVGQLYDAFELIKRTGKINELIEIQLEVEQHLRKAISPKSP